MAEFSTISQALKILSISRPTIYRRIKDGDIPSVRLGGRILIPAVFFEELKNRALSAAARPEGIQ
jgi:excisionase family DNA binding protein